jgi:transporter family protein
MADSRKRVPSTAQGLEGITVSWRNSLFGIGAAICFSLSAIFIRNGLEGLPSPLLGITVSMVIASLAYGGVLLFRRKKTGLRAISRDARLFHVAAGVTVALSTWARWIALELEPVAVVMTLGRVNVLVVIFLAPLLVGRKAERVTPRVWLGAALIIAGAILLNLYS